MIGNITNIFSAGITVYSLNDIDNERIIEYADNVEKIYSKNGYKDYKDILKNSLFNNLNTLVQAKMQEYYETIYSKRFNVVLYQAWANVGMDPYIILPHCHTGSSVISAVYYPMTTDGQLVFLNPMISLLSKQTTSMIENYNEFNSEYFKVSINAGYLIIFNSMLQHYVSHSSQKRISIGYDGALDPAVK